MYNGLSSVHIKPYINPNSSYIKRKEDEENKGGNSSSNAKYTYDNQEGKDTYQFTRQSFPNGEQTSIDYSQNTVNIAQIVSDFKNTTLAIGTPQEITDEVYGYLSLVEKQANKDEPNKKIIQTNLKNASQILDDYITKSLQKPSNVVNNWIDALFLQQVEYKADPDKINPAYSVNIPEDRKEKIQAQRETEKQLLETQQTAQQEVTTKKEIHLPTDDNLKHLFVSAKKLAKEKKDEKSLYVYNMALERAKQVGDTETQSMIYYEQGKIYDRHDDIASALDNYYMATELSTDLNLKTQAHYKMAKIYDETTNFEPAMEHYFDAISYAGETENISAQSKSLSNISYMYAQLYDTENTTEFGSLAILIAKEADDKKVLGTTYSNVADSFIVINELPKALDCYKEAVKYYTQTNSVQNLGSNFEKAAELMYKLGNNSKAEKLYEKSLAYYKKTGNTSAMKDVYEQLQLIKN